MDPCGVSSANNRDGVITDVPLMADLLLLKQKGLRDCSKDRKGSGDPSFDEVLERNLSQDSGERGSVVLRLG